MFGVEEAGNHFEVRTAETERIICLQDLEARRSICIALEPFSVKVVNIGGVKFEIEFAPIVFFGEITCTKIDPIG